jgi:hypothetical protein
MLVAEEIADAVDILFLIQQSERLHQI